MFKKENKVINTKGLEAGSLFKLCIIGILTFSIAMALLSFVAGLVFDGEWKGPQGYTSSSYKNEINNAIVSEKSEETTTTSSGIGGLVTYLAVTPFISVIFTAIIWVYVIIGIYIYSLKKPIQLKITDKGMSFSSAFKLIFIGFFVTSMLWGILTTLTSILEPEIGSWISFDGKELGVIGKLVTATIFVPIGSAVAAALMGLIIASGNYAFTMVKPISYVVNNYSK